MKNLRRPFYLAKGIPVFFSAIFTSLLFICSPNILLAQDVPQKDRVQGWSSDIDTLLTLMKQQHYVYQTKPLPAELIEKAAVLKTKVSQFSDERMVGELERLMWYMHDGHSYVVPVATKVKTFFLPIQLYLFSDGAYIIDAEDSYKQLIGDKILKIGGVDINKLIADMNSYVHQDNKYTVKWFAPSVLRFRGVYESYGLPQDSPDITVDLINRRKERLTQKVSFVAVAQFHSIPKLIPSALAERAPIPLYLSNVQDNFWFTPIPGRKKTLYFQFNQVEDKPNETLGSFGKRFDDTLQNMKPGLLIIDVRHNNGGNAGLLQPLMDAVINFEKNNANAKIIIITGRNTFSAAQIFIALMNKNTHALFAGEPSSSRPNFVGEENYFMLPWSGAIVSISNKYHESIPGDKREWITPDFPVLLSSAEYFQNQDPVLDLILKKFQ